MDPADNLYIAYLVYGDGLIEKRDAQGNWSVIARYGAPSALAVDAAGSFYVADTYNWRAQEYTPGGAQ